MNEREKFWAGEFGNEYNVRSPGSIHANVMLFAKILARTGRLDSVIEFGAGVGSNLVAIAKLNPGINPCAVEINGNAAAYLAEIGVTVVGRSMLEPLVPPPHEDFPGTFDLAFTKGVLIHIAPEDLDLAYQRLFRASRRWVLVAEYYNPKPVEVPYRGHAGRLWKRDFAGELLDRYPELRLVDYGFVYHRDEFPQDDLNWFLMEKRGEHGTATRNAAA